MVLDGGLLAGAEVAAVVEVHAVGDVREALRRHGRLHLGEELVFAVEASLGVVALVVGVFEFVGLEDLGGDWCSAAKARAAASSARGARRSRR